MSKYNHDEALCEIIGKSQEPFWNYRIIERSIHKSGQNIFKIFTCIRYLTGLEKLPGADLRIVSRYNHDEALCKIIGKSQEPFWNYREEYT